MGYRLGDLAERFQCGLHGDPEVWIESVCTLQDGRADAISFLANARYRKFLRDTSAGAVILRESDLGECSVSALISQDPYVTYARIAQLLYALKSPQPGIHESAVIAPSASIDSTARIAANVVIGEGVDIGARSDIGPGCVIDSGASIGADTRLVSNISVCHGVNIGRRVLIHPGVVLGSDGFGLANDHGVWVKLPQVGGVSIGDDVEIGANTTIDRGAVEDTVIEQGVKLDNQIQVAHNVHIGAHTAIAGCTAIAGSAKIGKHCMIGGAVGITGHLEVVDGVTITAMSLVTKSIKVPGVYSSGVAAMPNDQWNKTVVRMRQLDDIARRLSVLEKNSTESN